MDNLYIDSFPYLDALVGGWFHQDFDLAGGTLEEVVAAIKKSSPSEDWLGTKADIQRFLRTRGDGEIDADFVRLFQPGVDPVAWSGTTRTWLLKIYDLL